MIRQELITKHLNEPTWKTLATKHSVKDNGLGKALSECAKQANGDEYEAALKSLAVVTDLARKLRADRAVASNRDVCAYLDNVGKEVERARASVTEEKLESSKSDAEEEQAEVDDKKVSKALRTELLAGLQKAKTAECSVLVCVAAPVYGLMVAPRITPQHRAMLTQCTESTKFLALGACVWDEKSRAYIFVMQKRDSALAKQIQAAIKCFAALNVKLDVMGRADLAKYQGADSNQGGGQRALDQDENEPETSDSPSDEDDPKSSPNKNQAFTISASVGTNGKNNKADVQAVQTALNLRAKAGLTPDGKCGPQTVAAIMAYQKTLGTIKPDGLVQPGRSTARALAGAAIAKPAAAPKPMAPPKLGKATLAKADLVWHGTRAILDHNIGELRKAVIGHYGNEHPELLKEIDESMVKLDGVLDKLDTKLADSIAKASAAQDAESRKAELTNAKAILADYIKYVQSEPLIKHIDSNPFGVATNLGRVLSDSLVHMAQSLG